MTTPLRVLLVEDSATDAKLIVRALARTGRAIDFERVDTAKGMRAALERAAWDAVISDWSMPDFSAPLALAVLQELGRDVPFIVVSGTIGEEAAAGAMRAGAHDYVLKDNLARLGPAVERELRECEERRARRRAEHALLESEARYRRVVETTNQGVWIVDRELRTTFVNARMARMLGRDALDMVGRTPREFLDERGSATFEAHIAAHERSHDAGVSHTAELQLFRADGTSIWTLIESNRIVGATGVDDGFFALVMDNTARKQAEDARREAEAQRARLEDQLRHAQKMEAVGRLAGGVAHDFNNILSVILSCGEMLLTDLDASDRARDEVCEIVKAGKRAEILTRQLLMFSRQHVVAPRVLDLNELLANLEKMLRRLLGADIDLVLQFGAIGRIRADLGGIEQVVMNLVVNARDAMPTGGQLTLKTENVTLDETYARGHLDARPGPHVMLAVTDTGTGMSDATLARIFEPFFTTKEIGKGTGLGLSTAFGIVQQSCGTICVESQLGAGTTFKVYLPCVDACVEDADPAVAQVDQLGGAEVILLVDDDEQVRKVCHAILARHGYCVLDARDAVEALERCERYPGPIHLLLTDVVMPEVSGPDLAKRVAAARPGVKVLCMSGYTDDSIVRHGVRQARIAYLQKPITPHLLVRKVRDVLEGGGDEDQL